MLHSSLFWFVIFLIQITVAANTKVQFQEKITVALSERRPFVVFDEDGTPKGLDVLLIENFARKFNFQIDYYIMDSFENLNIEGYFNGFTKQTHMKYAYTSKKSNHFSNCFNKMYIITSQ